MDHLLPWIMVLAATIHVAEEYFCGWIEWVQNYAKGVNTKQFLVVNGVFLILSVFAAFSGHPFFVLSLASLFLINAGLHIAPTFGKKDYSPGVISSIVLYLPISLYVLISAMFDGDISVLTIALSAFLGGGVMILPIVGQFVYINMRKRKITKNM